MKEILQKQRDERFAGIRGASIYGRLPLREHLLQPILQEAVRTSGGKITRLTLSIQEVNILIVEARVAILFFSKDIRLRLRIDPVVDFAISPLLRIHIDDSQGMPSFVLDFLLSMLPFPESISVQPRLITINLKIALTRRNLHEFVPLIKRLMLSTQRGLAMIDFQFRVD